MQSCLNKVKFTRIPNMFKIPKALDVLVTKEEFDLWVRSDLSIEEVKRIVANNKD